MTTKRWRKFLAHDVDSYWAIELNVWPDVDKHPTYDINLKIADCTRSVNMYFGFDTERKRQKQLKKLNRLEEGLTRVRVMLMKAADDDLAEK